MPADPGDPEIHLIIQSDAHSVRAALQDLFGTHTLGDLATTERDTAELVLAEVLNNIVEHAHALMRSTIELTIRAAPQGLICTVVDCGRGMPGDCPPPGRLPEIPGEIADLPEGGFGWHLIRLLATDLAYRRVGNRNELSFRLSPGR
jgi:serine/threonine-protein kinase RsbW